MARGDRLPLGLREAVGPTSQARRVHALVFTDTASCLAAVSGLRTAGFFVADVHSPFPIHGLEEALGWRPTRLPWATFAGGAVGFVAGLGFQIWTHVVSWPLEIGGKTHGSLPALAPVTFELTILLAAFATVGALLIGRRLQPDLRLRPAAQPHARANDDRFVVLVVEQDATFSPERFARIVTGLAPTEIDDSWRVV